MMRNRRRIMLQIHFGKMINKIYYFEVNVVKKIWYTCLTLTTKSLPMGKMTMNANNF